MEYLFVCYRCGSLVLPVLTSHWRDMKRASTVLTIFKVVISHISFLELMTGKGLPPLWHPSPVAPLPCGTLPCGAPLPCGSPPLWCLLHPHVAPLPCGTPPLWCPSPVVPLPSPVAPSPVAPSPVVPFPSPVAPLPLVSDVCWYLMCACVQDGQDLGLSEQGMCAVIGRTCTECHCSGLPS